MHACPLTPAHSGTNKCWTLLHPRPRYDVGPRSIQKLATYSRRDSMTRKSFNPELLEALSAERERTSGFPLSIILYLVHYPIRDSC